VLNPLAGNANDKSVIVAAFFQIPQKVGRISSHETLSQDTISRMLRGCRVGKMKVRERICLDHAVGGF
jgi:hypothetical protein